jgi:hypothetical protein
MQRFILETLLEDSGEFFFACRARIHDDVTALHGFIHDALNMIDSQTALRETSRNPYICRKLFDGLNGAKCGVEERNLIGFFAKGFANSSEALRDSNMIKTHDSRQRYGDSQAMGNAEVPTSKRHCQRMSEAEPSGVHGDASERAAEQHGLA